MNKGRPPSGSVFFPRSFVSAYLLCAALFSLGVIAGSFFSVGFVESGAAAKAVSGFLPPLADVSDLGVSRWFLYLFRFPAMAFLLGFSALGTVGVPMLCFARGFSLAFSLSVLTRLYAGNGALMGIILFGVVSALAVPIFLTVASGAFCSSVRLGRAWVAFPVPPDSGCSAGAYFLRFIAATLLLLLLAVGENAALNCGLLSLPIFF